MTGITISGVTSAQCPVGQFVKVDASGGIVWLNLPPANEYAAVHSLPTKIVKIDGSPFAVIVQAIRVGESISGMAAAYRVGGVNFPSSGVVLGSQHQSVELTSDGNNWQITGGYSGYP